MLNVFCCTNVVSKNNLSIEMVVSFGVKLLKQTPFVCFLMFFICVRKLFDQQVVCRS